MINMRIQPITTDFEKDNYKAVPDKYKEKDQVLEEKEMKTKKKKKRKYNKKGG